MSWIAVRTDSSLNPTFFPLPGVYETFGTRQARAVVRVDGVGFEVAPAIQYSDDGVHWYSSSGVPLGLGVYSPYRTGSWIRPSVVGGGPDQPEDNRTVLATWMKTPIDFVTLSDGAAITERLFCRFGLLVRRQSDASDFPRGGRVMMTVTIDPNEAKSGTYGPIYAPSGGGTGSVATALDTPISGWIRTTDLGQVRDSWEIDAADGVQVSLAYQTSNDGVSVASSGTIGSSVLTTNGLHCGTAFTSVSMGDDALYVRFCARVRNSSNTDVKIRGVRVTLRVDRRP